MRLFYIFLSMAILSISSIYASTTQEEASAATVQNPTTTKTPADTTGGGTNTTPQTQTDSTPLVLALNGQANITLEQNTVYTEKGATAQDAVDGTVAVATSGTVDTSMIDNDTVTYTATDSAGNEASITDNTIIAKQDRAVTLQAKVGNVLSNKIQLNITWTVNGHALPPEPDKVLNDSTLLGIDVNDNGVRDDVERWIYEEYKDNHPIYIDIAMQEGRGNKLILEHLNKVKEIYTEVERAIDCQAYYMYFAKYYGDPILIKEDAIDEYFTSEIYFNTQERMDAYDKYDTLLSGDSYALPAHQERKDTCDFNTSKYEE